MNTLKEEIEILKLFSKTISNDDNEKYTIRPVGIYIFHELINNFHNNNGIIPLRVTLYPSKINKYDSVTLQSKLNMFTQYYRCFYSFDDIIDAIERLAASNKYESFELHLRITSYKVIQQLTDINYIGADNIYAVCKKCKTAYAYKPSDDIEDIGNFCCIGIMKAQSKKYMGITRASDTKLGKKNFKEFKEFFEHESPNAGKFILKDTYTLQCRHKHIFRLTKYLSAFDAMKELKCWICDEDIEEKYELFKLLKELDANYYIAERDKSSVDTIGVKRDLKKIAGLNIYTYNDKKHLTGKIVFNDLFGEQQAKANSNHLVFRWFDLNYLNDYNYCKTFLLSFFEDIVRKNNLK